MIEHIKNSIVRIIACYSAFGLVWLIDKTTKTTTDITFKNTTIVTAIVIIIMVIIDITTK